ncbi:nucleotide exchange factor GrpE [Tichowtungia aerotolerans]|uniref:Protein GrpE n=1 Tax=Tichowtungia aerotolerans TaxID=2697043 RepID=A0A6P1M903_9BACT|nr:nucleotide exchange factor GrpE [Tichowtungia aerotolerans]QHI69553.1 nucleotide exchange factor GrpE [Tichowtungia aerotolerans]
MSEEKQNEPIEQEEAVATEETAEEQAPAEDVEIIEEEKEEEEPLRIQLMRLQADFDNFRKRQVRERADWITRANEDLFLELLPVLDHYEMGLKSAEDHHADKSVTEGFKMVYNQLIDLLEKFNVTSVEAIGEAFNPHVHEALTHMPSDKPSETVIEQVRRGYMLGDKLLRAAQVVVSSGPAEAKDSE